MTLSDLKAFEAWFRERRGISFAEAQPLCGREDLRMVKAAYAAGLTRGTQETMKVMAQPLSVQLPAPLVQIGWRWAYRPGSPPGHTHSHVYETPGPTESAIAAAQNSCFAPVTVQPVYVLKEIT
jgi:hypothetical protein